MPKGHSLSFRAKRELQCIFLGKKEIIITSKHGTTILFSHKNPLPGKLKENWIKKGAQILSEYIELCSWTSHYTP